MRLLVCAYSLQIKNVPIFIFRFKYNFKIYNSLANMTLANMFYDYGFNFWPRFAFSFHRCSSNTLSQATSNNIQKSNQLKNQQVNLGSGKCVQA